MNQARLALCLFTIALTAALGARKRYDERGNPMNTAAETQGQSGAEAKPNADTPPQQVPATSEQTSTANQASPTSESPSVEQEAAQKPVSNPLTKVYLENAQVYLRSGRVEKALESLRRSAEAGEDNHSREARLQAYWLRARRGDAGLAAEAEAMDEATRSAALLRIADGYYACARESKQKPDCLAEAERIYAFLAELAPAATEGKLAAFRLAQLLLDLNRLEAALPHLTRLLADEQLNGKSARAIPYDRAWYTLGSLYERPWYHRDTHKARLAYRQVLRYPDSPYHRQAKERIAWLERFGIGYPATGRP